MQYGHFEDDKREYVIDRAMEFFNALCPYCQNDKIEIRKSFFEMENRIFRIQENMHDTEDGKREGWGHD